jgi:hypothetical protein
MWHEKNITEMRQEAAREGCIGTLRQKWNIRRGTGKVGCI